MDVDQVCIPVQEQQQGLATTSTEQADEDAPTCFICFGSDDRNVGQHENDVTPSCEFGLLLDLACTQPNHHFAHQHCLGKWLEASAGEHVKWKCPFCQRPFREEFIRQYFGEFEFKLALQPLFSSIQSAAAEEQIGVNFITSEDVKRILSMFVNIPDSTAVSIQVCTMLCRVLDFYFLSHPPREWLCQELLSHALQKCLFVKEILNGEYETEGVLNLFENLCRIYQFLFLSRNTDAFFLKYDLFNCFKQLWTNGCYKGEYNDRFSKLGRRLLAACAFGDDLTPLLGDGNENNFRYAIRLAFQERDYSGALVVCMREKQKGVDKSEFWREVAVYIKDISPSCLCWRFIKHLTPVLIELVKAGVLLPDVAVNVMDGFRLAYTHNLEVQDYVWSFACDLLSCLNWTIWKRLFWPSLKIKKRLLTWISDGLLPENFTIACLGWIPKILDGLLSRRWSETFRGVMDEICSRLARDMNNLLDDGIYGTELAQVSPMYKKFCSHFFYIMIKAQTYYCQTGWEYLSRELLTKMVCLEKEGYGWELAKLVLKDTGEQRIEEDVILARLNNPSEKYFLTILMYYDSVLSPDDFRVLAEILRHKIARYSERNQTQEFLTELKHAMEDSKAQLAQKESALRTALVDIFKDVVRQTPTSAAEENTKRKQAFLLLSLLVTARVYYSWMLDVLFRLLEKQDYFSLEQVFSILPALIRQKHVTKDQVDHCLELITQYKGLVTESSREKQLRQITINRITSTWTRHRAWGPWLKSWICLQPPRSPPTSLA